MTMDGFEFITEAPRPKAVCVHQGDGKHCTSCGEVIHPQARVKSRKSCCQQHKKFCQVLDYNHCPHCGEDVSIYRFFQIAGVHWPQKV